MTIQALSTDAADSPRTARRRRFRPYGAVGAAVASRAARLQSQVLSQHPAQAKATLARLRAAITTEPGSVPAVWEITAIFSTSPVGDGPTREERAAHVAMTLFAVHQQSQGKAMHVPGVGFGEAVRRLAPSAAGKVDTESGTAAASPSFRRFQALATASTLSESVNHARGLIQQLRAAGVGLDYGLFADDLVKLQHPRLAAEVRLQWGRDYFDPQGQASAADTDAEPADAGLADA